MINILLILFSMNVQILLDNGQIHKANGKSLLIPIDGLVAYYPMEEMADTAGSGNDSTCFDESETGNDGIVYKATAIDTGKIGNAYEFEGKNKYIEANYNSLEIGDPLTLIAWIYPNNLSDANFLGQFQSPNSNWIFRLGEDVSDNEGELELWTSGDGWIQLDHSPLSADQWHHVAVSYKSTEIVYYIDGQSVASGTPSVGTIDTADCATGIGIRSVSEPLKYPFHGIIDEVMIFDRALDSLEVKALYEATK